MLLFFIKKFRNLYIWKRLFLERLAEPIHLNVISIFVAVFGTYRAKIAFDLILRQQHAFALLKAADYAKVNGIARIAVIEFGVANGAGLINICKICERLTKITGIEFSIVGFDTGKGMPTPRDFRDHPEYYSRCDFPMQNQDALRELLPKNAKLLIGDVSATVPEFLRTLDSPIGFVSIDVDYYWSTVEALRVMDGPPENYLPLVPMYIDDVEFDGHSIYAGELLALEEFNQQHSSRKITKFSFLRQKRIFQRPNWIDHTYTLHVFDHPSRNAALSKTGQVVLTNPYLKDA